MCGRFRKKAWPLRREIPMGKESLCKGKAESGRLVDLSSYRYRFDSYSIGAGWYTWKTKILLASLFSVKFACGEWNLASPSEIASLWNICFANVKGEFHFTSNGVRYFTISARKLFHIRRQPNISLIFPSCLEKYRKMCYNKIRKAVAVWKK